MGVSYHSVAILSNMTLHKKIGAWMVDYGYMVRGALATIIHRKPPKHYLGHIVTGKASVILIPGITHRWGYMKHLGDKISLEGHPVYIVPDLGYNLSDISTSAKILHSLLIKENISGVVLVAHSKGGLIGKYLLVHHNADNRVLGMVAIATPFSGSAMAKLVPHESFRELLTDSEIIRNLEKHSAVNEHIISIIPEYDNHVWAEQGSYLDGAADNIEVPVKRHHKVLFSEHVLQTILDSIEKLQNRVTAL